MIYDYHVGHKLRIKISAADFYDLGKGGLKHYVVKTESTRFCFKFLVFLLKK